MNCDSKKMSDEPLPPNDSAPHEKLISAKQENDSQFIKIKIADLIKREPTHNPLILSGDIITVLEAEPIYVIGGVANPKQINAHSQITVSRAIAAAGALQISRGCKARHPVRNR